MRHEPDRLAYTVAVAALAMTFALVLMGALVTNNEAGDSVPDWPLAWGQVVPADHLSGKVVFEYTHRAIAGLVGVCTLLLAALVLVREKRTLPKALAAAALLLVIAQAFLGGIRVRLGETHSYGIAMLHAFTAQLFLGTLSAALLSLSPAWSSAPPAKGGDAARSGGLVALGFGSVAAVLLQILLGAGFRHRVLGALPHALDAVLVVVLVALLGSRFSRRGAGRHRTFSRLAAAALGAQLILGVVIYLLLRRADSSTGTAAATVIVAVLHLGFGSALLFACVGCAFWTLREPSAA